MPHAICFDCHAHHAERVPDPIPDGYICEHFTPEYWEKQGYVRGWGDASVMNWPHLEILRKEVKRGDVSFVVLAPFSARRPVILEHGWGMY